MESADFLTRHARELAGDLGLRSLAGRVEVSWNPRLKTTAGRAQLGQGLARVELNPRLKQLPVPQRASEIRRTLRHELAHLVAYVRAGRRRIKPHGEEWKQACKDLGIAGETAYHSLGLAPSRKQRVRFGYQCPQCHEVLKRVRRIKGKVACLACCQKFARGRFDARFTLVPFRLSVSEEQ